LIFAIHFAKITKFLKFDSLIINLILNTSIQRFKVKNYYGIHKILLRYIINLAVKFGWSLFRRNAIVTYNR
jgi:hypothetical protein